MSSPMLYAEFLGNMLLFLILDVYCRHYMKQREKVNVPLCRAFFLAISILYTFFPRIHFYAQILVLIHFLYMLLTIKVTPIKYLFHFVVYLLLAYALSTAILTICFTVYAYITPITMDQVEIATGYLMVTVLFYIYLLLTTHIMIKRISNYNNSGKYKFYFILFVVLTILLLFGINVLYTYSPLDADNVPTKVIQITIPAIEMITLAYIAIFRKCLDMVEENIALGTELSVNTLQKNFFARTEENLTTISHIRHDFKNHLIILQDLANKGQLEEFNQYVEEIQGNLIQTSLISTPSGVLSAILNSKAQDCALSGVTFTTELNVPLWTMNDYDTVVILGNLLDNAITAAEKCESPYVHLILRQVDSYLDIDCTNNHCEALNFSNGIYYTTKEEHKELHGLGLAGIRRAVNRVNGTLDIDHTDDTFHVLVSFPNYE